MIKLVIIIRHRVLCDEGMVPGWEHNLCCRGYYMSAFCEAITDPWLHLTQQTIHIPYLDVISWSVATKQWPCETLPKSLNATTQSFSEWLPETTTCTQHPSHYVLIQFLLSHHQQLKLLWNGSAPFCSKLCCHPFNYLLSAAANGAHHIWRATFWSTRPPGSKSPLICTNYLHTQVHHRS